MSVINQSIATEILTAVLERMESGNEQKCRGAFHQGGAFCAIGLICDELVKRFPDRFHWRPSPRYDEQGDPLPLTENEYVFVDSFTGDASAYTRLPVIRDLIPPEVSALMMSENDSGVPFSEIAMYVRALITQSAQ